ncbi:sulfotransferase domain-containing protein [Pseudokineococcus basanitobsidens]|uniref:Sulfotransferase domain-containing protein n=1 Tax=Pseudokineococcus basanitobsidens TaxID=1926649 RepID=A0ABU8RML8_9ACTN
MAAREGLLRLTEVTARPTAAVRSLPDFLVVGGQRCGTTSLFKTLVQHRQISPPALRKGIHYFDVHYDEGPAWYRGHFPVRRPRLGGPRRLTGESSPYYMFHPLAGRRIADDLPDVRLLVLLRDPVERAYSAHAHESARGFETLDFEAALEQEDQRLAGEAERVLFEPGYESFHLQHHGYLSRGRYLEHLQRLEQLVGRERMHVVDSGDFFSSPEATFAPVLTFLGLPQQEGIAFERHNARARTAMPEALRARLAEHFAPADAGLAQWWGRTPSWRR